MQTRMSAYPAHERIELLQGNYDSKEETKYYKDLGPEELDVKRESLTENLIQLSTWEDELTDIKEDFKEKMKPKKEENKTLLEQVKTRKELVTGTLYLVADHEAAVMETYDQQGEFISSRRLKPEERQQKLFIQPIKQAQ